LGAQQILFVNMRGEILATAGTLKELDGARFALLIASGFQATLVADSALGPSDAGTIIMQSGQQHNACSVRVGNDGILIILFDKATVALHKNLWPGPIRRAAEELQQLLPTAKSPPSEGASGPKNARAELRNPLYMPFPKADGTEQKQGGLRTPSRREAPVSHHRELPPDAAKESPDQAEVWTEASSEVGDFSTLSKEGISIEDARAMGLIDDDVLARLINDESEKS
jgi:hypothetical protein